MSRPHDLNLTRHTFSSPRHTTSYLEAGPANGPLMIFLHGWPQIGLMWRAQMDSADESLVLRDGLVVNSYHPNDLRKTLTPQNASFFSQLPVPSYRLPATGWSYFPIAITSKLPGTIVGRGWG